MMHLLQTIALAAGAIIILMAWCCFGPILMAMLGSSIVEGTGAVLRLAWRTAAGGIRKIR